MPLAITLTTGALHQALDHLLRRPGVWVSGPAGSCRTADGEELICPRLAPGPPSPIRGPSVAVTLDAASPAASPPTDLPPWHDPRYPLALVRLGVGDRRGTLTAHLVAPEHRPVPVETVRLNGPGMHRFVLASPGQTADTLEFAAQDRWSRQIGGVGGAVVFQRLRGLRVAIVGLGRSGSQLAAALARTGLTRLTLIDPDRVEAHNLDMAGLGPQDLGRRKTEAVAAALRRTGAETGDLALHPVTVTSLRGLAVAKGADLIACCVDNDGARLAAGLIAALYARPLLDIGTGVHGGGPHRRLGADIRLILPGAGCLSCGGGVADPREAVAIFRAGAADPEPPWQLQRAGSLISLNGIAVNLALRLIEDLVAERLTGSTWLRLEFDPHGLPRLEPLPMPSNRDCPLCGLVGTGDEGLGPARQLGAGALGLATGNGSGSTVAPPGAAPIGRGPDAAAHRRPLDPR